MIQIDEDKCTRCGLCAAVCGGHVLEMGDGCAKWAHPASCNECYHCVAVCPAAAVSCDAFPLDAFTPLAKKKDMPTPGQVQALFAARRSVREFKDAPVPRELLEELIKTGAHAPTGRNDRATRFVVVTDPEIIRKLDKRISALFDGFMNTFDNKLGETIAHTLGGDNLENELKEYHRRARQAKRDGHAGTRNLHGAPALIAAHTGTDAATGHDDAAIALSHIMAHAVAAGLGATWIGVLTGAAKVDPGIKRLLRVPWRHTIHNAMILGVPKYKYARSVPRATAGVTWIE